MLSPKFSIGYESLENALISGRELVIAKLVGSNPFKISATERFRFSTSQMTPVKIEADCFFRVDVGEALEQIDDGDLNPKFFVEFAPQTLLKSFARLALASRELP